MEGVERLAFLSSIFSFIVVALAIDWAKVLYL